LACVPLFCWLLFGRGDRTAAAWLLAGLGCTDWVDGYLARHLNQVSELGKVLDPTADRILLGVGIVAILVDGSVPAWVAWLVIVREALVSLAVLALAACRAPRIDVQWVGKTGTFLLMFAFPFFLAGHAPGFAGRSLALTAAWAFALPGLVFSWYSAITYVPMGLAALREGRSRLQAPAG
jgi:cardiolipin synthase